MASILPAYHKKEREKEERKKEVSKKVSEETRIKDRLVEFRSRCNSFASKCNIGWRTFRCRELCGQHKLKLGTNCYFVSFTYEEGNISICHLGVSPLSRVFMQTWICFIQFQERFGVQVKPWPLTGYSPFKTTFSNFERNYKCSFGSKGEISSLRANFWLHHESTIAYTNQTGINRHRQSLFYLVAHSTSFPGPFPYLVLSALKIEKRPWERGCNTLSYHR